MALIVVLVTGAAVTWASVALPSTEMWSIVVDSAQDVPARQLGVVGEALFRAEDTYTEAMLELGMSGDPDQLYRGVKLRSVPESRLLIVIARQDDIYRASITSDAMAQSLVHAFERSGYPGLRVLGAPQIAPVPSGLSVPAIGLMGAVLGIVLALAVAIVAYRVRRPVLSLHRAAAIVHPDAVHSVPGAGRWLGALRRRAPVSAGAALRSTGERLREAGATLLTPGQPPRDRQRLAEALGIADDTGQDPPGRSRCDPRTRERDLGTARGSGATSVELLWIA